MKLPIAIMSFERPQYLERVLQNVMRQRGFGGFEPVFYLFQDGAFSRYTGERAGSPEAIQQSIDMFRAYIPEGVTLASEVNLGVALNFDRAERILFEDYGYEAAIFLEDDLLLQPHYFDTMAGLIDAALKRDDVGMVTAYGFRHTTSLAEQRAREREVCLMDEHNWAFGITRAAWRERDRIIQGYLEFVSDIEYRARGSRNAELKAFQRAFGRGGKGYLTSQDSMKNLALEVLGIHRISTYTNNARYIGRVGEHSTAEKFDMRGYSRTVLYDRLHREFDVPSPEALRKARAGLATR